MTIQDKSTAVLTVLFLELIFLLLATHASQQVLVQCGKPNSKVNQFPWMAHILIRNLEGRLLTCSGTLISAQHLLTAAHCLVENGSDRLYRILNITLGARDVSPDSNDRSNHQVFTWKVLTVPELHDNIIEHNIAILSLSKPALFNDYVQPACLPFTSDSDRVNNSVVFTGWGHSTGALQCCSREPSAVRRQWNTTIISTSGNDIQCLQPSTMSKFSNANDFICTDGSQQHRFCNGDDGGPLNYYNSKLDRWFVIGIAGRGNSDNCRIKSSSVNANKRPNMMTRVRSHLEFIREHSGVIPPVTKNRTRLTSRRRNRIRSTSTTEAPTTSATNGTRNLPEAPFTCEGKAAGNYPNPTVNCSPHFLMCSDNKAFPLACSHGLMYRADANVCDWPSNVPECSSKNVTSSL